MIWYDTHIHIYILLFENHFIKTGKWIQAFVLLFHFLFKEGKIRLFLFCFLFYSCRKMHSNRSSSVIASRAGEVYPLDQVADSGSVCWTGQTGVLVSDISCCVSVSVTVWSQSVLLSSILLVWVVWKVKKKKKNLPLCRRTRLGSISAAQIKSSLGSPVTLGPQHISLSFRKKEKRERVRESEQSCWPFNRFYFMTAD